MLVCTHSFVFEKYKSPDSAKLTARWFAAWLQLNNCLSGYEVTGDRVNVTGCNEPYEVTNFTIELSTRIRQGEKPPVTIPPPLKEFADRGIEPEELLPEKNWRAVVYFMIHKSFPGTKLVMILPLGEIRPIPKSIESH